MRATRAYVCVAPTRLTSPLPASPLLSGLKGPGATETTAGATETTTGATETTAGTMESMDTTTTDVTDNVYYQEPTPPSSPTVSDSLADALPDNTAADTRRRRRRL